MAWEEENIDSGMELGESGGGKKKLIMIVVGVLVLAAIGFARFIQVRGIHDD